MTPKETVARANQIIEKQVFPAVREMFVGKRMIANGKIQMELLKDVIFFAKKRLNEIASVEDLNLQDTELVAIPDMSTGIVNMMSVTREEADLIREELQKRNVPTPLPVEKEDDVLPN